MKFRKPLAALFLLLSMFMGQSALATTPIENCDILYAGQSSNAGQVCVTVNTVAGTVSIDYKLGTGWALSEVHAWVGEDLALMPQNRKGNPQVGHFPHSASGLGGVSTYSFVIPLSDLPINADTFCGAEVFVAAHAVVSRNGGGKAAGTDSAWAGSNQIGSGGSWARHFSFTNDFCDDTDPEYPMVVLPESCFNVFGQGVPGPTLPVAVTPFTPVGVTGTSSAWLNTYGSAPGYFGGDLISGNGTRIGGFIAGLVGSSFVIEIDLDTNASPAIIVDSANVYFNAAGGYQTQSPVDYNLKFVGNGTLELDGSVELASVPPFKDTVIHAIVCLNGVD